MEDALPAKEEQISPWGPDPINELGHLEKSERWWSHSLHKEARSSQDPLDWEQYFGPHAQWVDTKDQPSEALTVLRALQYRASTDSETHIRSFAAALRNDLIPSHPVDIWKEWWMRQKFVETLVSSRPGSAMGDLADATLSKWPWLFVWAGEHLQDYRHPLVRAVRAGNTEIAERLLEIAPITEWIAWPGSKNDYFSFRGLWRDRNYWFNQNETWVNRLVEIAPEFREPHPATGLGPLEQAARDNLPDLLRKLLAQGWTPDPAKSFGLTLSHWAINGLSEEKWNAKAEQKEPKTPSEIEDSAQRCGQTLAVLAEFGFGLHDPVLKTEKIEGVRRPRLPKVKTTASKMLEEMCEKERLKPDTLAILQQANMLASTTKVLPSTRSRSRL